MTDQDHDRSEPEAPVPVAPEAELRRPVGRAPRPAPESDVKAYIPPVDLPFNQDDARRTQELSRVQISADLDARRKQTVRRMVAAPPVEPGPPLLDSVPEETASLGTNLAAIDRAGSDADSKKNTLKMRQGASVASPSATPAPDAGIRVDPPADGRAGPRGTVILNPRARGGTRMMMAGVAEAGAMPAASRASSGDSVRPGPAVNVRVVVLGAIVLLGTATLALFASRGIALRSPEPVEPVAAETSSVAPSPEPVATAAAPAPSPSSAPAPEASPTAAASDGPSDEPSHEVAPPRRARPRAKPGKRAPDAAASTTPRAAPKPMFERTEGH